MSATQRLLSETEFEHLRQSRAQHPKLLSEILADRERRELLAGDGRLMIVAADHPARGALGVGNRAMAMADRYELLDRLAQALSRPGVDGVLGTPDIIDDLALLGLLEGKIVVASTNRGGLRGAAFEMDDRVTGYDIDSIVRDRLDFAKTLLRINFDDAGTTNTLVENAQLVNEAVTARLPIMLEPFISRWVDGRIQNDLSPDAVIQSIAIASGLGNSSAYTWLKLPVVDEMERVMAATTLPTLLLGGDPSGAAEATYRRWRDALTLPGVHGLVVGRTLLYPENDNVAAAVDTAATLVHG